MTVDPLLACESVRKSFGSGQPVPALAEVTFSVLQGEQVCITGASGSGKTTLLTIIGGLQLPTSGNVKICGKSLLTMPGRELAALRARKIGLVFQSSALIPVLSARENIEYALQIAKPELTKTDRKQLVDDALVVTNLEAKQNLRPGQLSGGECQRVAIARAVVKRPSLLLADEPTSQLDDDNAAAICNLFEELQHHYHSAIVIATHDARVLSIVPRTIRLQLVSERLQSISPLDNVEEVAT